MQEDMNVLITKHKGLVYKQLHKFGLVKDPEAESIGYEALYNALKNYDKERGNAISTVATVYIYNALGTYVRSLNKRRQVHTVSYNNVIYSDSEKEHEFLDTMPAAADVEQEYINKEVGKIALEVFDKQYNAITSEKRKAILGAWRDSGFTAPTTEISRTVGVSQSYVSQVINGFKAVLKKELEDVYYD